MAYIIRRELKYLAAALLVCLLLLAVVPSASAADTSSMIAPSSVALGKTFDVTVKIHTPTPLSKVTGSLFYDDTASFVSSNCVSEGRGGGLAVSFSSEGETIYNAELTFTFTAVSEGACKFSFSGEAFAEDETRLAAPEFSATVNITAREGGVLVSLVPSDGELLPAFSQDIYDYVLNVESDVQYVKFTAQALSESDTIQPDDLRFWDLDSEKPKEIKVIDADGNERTYYISIKREPAPDESSEDETESTEPSGDETSQPESTEQESSEDTRTTPAQTDPEDTQPDEASEDKPAAAVSKADSSSSRADGMSELRKTLMPALLVTLAVLIIALIIVIYWIKNRSERRRRKIRSSKNTRK